MQIERGLEKVTEAASSARIIDLAAYRSTRRQQRTEAGTASWRSDAASPWMGSFATPIFWFWPTWVWIPVPVPAATAVRWDAS
ncbi:MULTISPECIES: hypothetical protein [Bradyrhizobium]|uniref:hypothetical protein n=1 Tax=Bradyrhizobium TaxID=374 RepID=UPI0004AD0891|nr:MULTISPECIES: hypothetical protein [Bradyrhizobium]MCS3451238.1 hypothetical protein [Bradyrhizobium elkanii]MCS3566739.1 hypothetical protein [Bradyrhizobium elkanii]MCW2152536.1 hypothetical protein [Bradyrhizobium elkanii]MCW2357586.1 hypothetical protein [Bradyrhizobium elkanii]MCW2376267.1 hypothetical protein [Bradyrhizobium elkanii]